MSELPAEIPEARGGLGRWNEYERVDATHARAGEFRPVGRKLPRPL